MTYQVPEPFTSNNGTRPQLRILGGREVPPTIPGNFSGIFIDASVTPSFAEFPSSVLNYFLDIVDTNDAINSPNNFTSGVNQFRPSVYTPVGVRIFGGQNVTLGAGGLVDLVNADGNSINLSATATNTAEV